MTKKILMQLRTERNKLRRLAFQKKKAELKRKKALRDELKLKREIKQLKIQTSRNIISRIRGAITSPQTKKKANKALKGFQKLADRVGGDPKKTEKLIKEMF